MTRLAFVALYLAAIVAANLSVAHWGPQAAIYNAFLFIGLDLTCRDRLHDLWHRHLLRNMAALIATGSLLTLAISPGTARIAAASALAFGAAAVADATVYQLLRRRPWYERVNQSNLAGAAVDSAVFPTVAFGAWSWPLVFGLFCAKVAGGVVWSFLLRKEAAGADPGTRRAHHPRGVQASEPGPAQLTTQVLPGRQRVQVGGRQ